MFLVHAPESLPYTHIIEILVRFIYYVYSREFSDASCFRYMALYCQSLSLSLSLIACPKPSTRFIAIILTPFFNQSVNILENIHGKQDVTQIVQFPVFIQTDLKGTESAIGSGRLNGCWPSIAAVPWRIKLLLEVFM